jgi:hypothetical protein
MRRMVRLRCQRSVDIADQRCPLAMYPLPQRRMRLDTVPPEAEAFHAASGAYTAPYLR